MIYNLTDDHFFSDGLKLNHQLDKDLPAHHPWTPQDVEVAFADAVRSGHARQVWGVGCRFGRGSGGLKSRRSGYKSTFFKETKQFFPRFWLKK